MSPRDDVLEAMLTQPGPARYPAPVSKKLKLWKVDRPLTDVKRRLNFALIPLQERDDALETANIAWQTLKELASGRPFIPILPDGREAEPRVPTDSVRLKAATELLDRLYGRAASAAELREEQRTLEASPVDQMSDSEVVEQVQDALKLLTSRGLTYEEAASNEPQQHFDPPGEGE